jgi:hypothetical protein
MPDIATISAALSSIKTATDIAKFLRESDLSLEKAELKLKLADLVVALADAKMDLVNLQDDLAEKDKKIAELTSAFESKESLVRHGDGYYATNSEGNPTGKPFCLRCWENDHKQRQLVQSPKDHFLRLCASCGQQYDGRSVSEIRPKPGETT